MHMKTIVSAGALAIALGFTGSAVAQTMIGNQSVSAADMERVKVYCEDLQTAENQAEGTNDNGIDLDESSGTGTPSVGSVDMDAITLENCIEAGVVERVGQ